MNCKDVQELLPLYVGRDLEERRAKLVMAHVKSCAECAGSVEEYRETRELLQQFAPPPFSDEVYAGIRQRVLRDIERESAAPGLSQLLESLFRPRLRWAVATALLLAVSAFAFYFIASRKTDLTNDRKQIADGGHPVAAPSTSPKEVPPAGTKRNKGTVRGLAATHQSQRRQGTEAVRDRTRPATVNNADPISPDNASLTAEASPGLNNLAEPDAVPARDPATSEKTLRVEMQTKDPNIRIIWFTPQPTKHDSPSKFSKGI
jgi:Putative zinc-finger